MFKTVSDVHSAEPDLGTFMDEWRSIQETLGSPLISEEQILQTQIPEGKQFVCFKGYFDTESEELKHHKGQLVLCRLVRGREGLSVVIDHRIDTNHLIRVQRALEERIGRLMMTVQPTVMARL